MADQKITELASMNIPLRTDIIPIVDDPGGAPVTKKITLEDLLTVINDLSTDTSPVLSTDFIVTYDASASAAKKVLLSNAIRVTNTFTPTIVGTTTAGVGTYSTQLGEYYAIGDLVFFEINLVWTAHTGTGNMRVGGLPFTAKNNSINVPCSVAWSSIALSGTAYKLILSVLANNTEIEIREVEGGSFALVPIDSAATLRVSGMYIKA